MKQRLRDSGDAAPCNYKLGNRWRWMCNFKLQPLYLGAGTFDKNWTLVSVCPKATAVNKKSVHCLPTPRLVTMLTELIRLIIYPVYEKKTQNYAQNREKLFSCPQ